MIKDKCNLDKNDNISLTKKLLSRLIYNSAKLEGINITFPETQTILEGINVSNIKLDDITCILNLRDAWRDTLNKIDEPLNLSFICSINSLVSRNESLKWGVLRYGKVGISGTSYIPDIPKREDVEKKISEILSIENITLRALKYALYGMRAQLFWDGNKRTSMIIANKILISNGKGVFTIKDEYLLDFNKLLTDYYNTNDDSKIIEFLYKNCIYGID